MQAGVRSYKPLLSLGVKHSKPSHNLGQRYYLNSTSNSLIEPKHTHDIYNHVSNSNETNRIPMTHTNFGGSKPREHFSGHKEHRPNIEKHKKDRQERFT